MNRGALITALFSGLLVVFYAFLSLFLPVSQAGPGLDVDVEAGTSFRRTVRHFASVGLIRDPGVFEYFGRMTGLDKKVMPGRYVFEGAVSPWDVYTALRKGDITPVVITVVEGDCLGQIREKLAGGGIVEADEFDALVKDPGFMEELDIEAPSLEGYLFPDTYRISAGMGAREVLAIMVRRLREKLDEGLLSRALELGLDENEVLTLASIIEKEAALDEERPIISAVYHNRLKKGMRLQADPTAVYGVKPPGSAITRMDVRRKTPYNTYFFKGLPPGPIASPGLESIRAALYPAEAPFLYFVSNQDGTHTFSATHREHRRAVERNTRGGGRPGGTQG